MEINEYISTTTVIVKSNLKLNIEEIFHILPITEYEIQKKKRGRQKKNTEHKEENIPNLLKNGSIVSVSLKDISKGVEMHKPKIHKQCFMMDSNEKVHKKYFRNAMTIVIYINKFINFKISSNGNFQITGSKNITESMDCILYFLYYIHLYPHLYSMNSHYETITNQYGIYFMFKTVMTNIVFKLGFNINREKLDKLVIKDTPWNSLFETSLGYTGVNIKVPLDNIDNYNIYTIYFKSLTPVSTFETFKNQSVISNLLYVDLKNMEDIYYELYKNGKEKNFKNTFLVFQSGSVIMSGIELSLMKESFDTFISFINDIKSDIKEEIK